MNRSNKFQSTQPEWAATEIRKQRDIEQKISIHAARMGCDRTLCRTGYTEGIFQSTQPEWAATATVRQSDFGTFNFNPRSPNGLRLIYIGIEDTNKRFQSTQPEWAATKKRTYLMYCTPKFQSTQPEWAATTLHRPISAMVKISIHAARMGCDGLDTKDVEKGIQFQSTQPEWAAT